MNPSRQRILTLAFCVYAVSTLISMAVMSVGATLLLAAMLVGFRGPKPFLDRLREEARPGSWGRLYLFVSAGLAIACLASLVAAIFWPLSYAGRFSQVHLLRDPLKLWYLFWPLLLAAGLRALPREGRTRILACWISAFAVLSCVGIQQYFTGWPRPQRIPELSMVRYHATLFLGHHLTVASVLIFPFFASLDFGLRSVRERVFGWPRWIWPLVLAAGATTLFFTYSRTLEAALPVGLLVWIFLNLPRRAAYVAVPVVLLSMALLWRLPVVQARFSGWNFSEGVSTREDLWKANLAFLERRPVLGVGWKHNQELSGYYLMEKYHSNDVFSGHAHDNFLDMLGGTGVAGAAFWLAWSLLILAMAWQAIRLRPAPSGEMFASGLFCAWIVFQINGLTQVNFWDAKVTHQMMWVAAWTLLWLGTRSSAVRLTEK